MPIARLPDDYLDKLSKEELIKLVKALYDAWDELDCDYTECLQFMNGEWKEQRK